VIAAIANDGDLIGVTASTSASGFSGRRLQRLPDARVYAHASSSVVLPRATQRVRPDVRGAHDSDRRHAA
jgi:hypothetical protein